MPITRSNCPVCAQNQLVPIATVDALPLVCNEFYDSAAKAKSVKIGHLDLRFCRSCGHVFNAAFDEELINYTESYDSTQWFSKAFIAYADELIQRLDRSYKLSDKTIIDIGCGKGDWLKRFCAMTGAKGIGFDKSFTRHPDEDRDVTFVNDWFSDQYKVNAGFVLCRHVVEHISDPVPFLKSIRTNRNVRPDTLFYFEVPNGSYVFREEGAWEIIYEHVSYFTPPSLITALQEAGFSVIETGTSFGDQYLYAVAKPMERGAIEGYKQRPSIAVGQVAKSLIDFQEVYARKIAFWKKYFNDAGHDDVVVWGAGAKGVIFVNAMPRPTPVTAMVDLNPRKQGRFAPVTATPVISPDLLREFPVRTVIIMNRQYESEISSSIKALGIRAKTMIA